MDQFSLFKKWFWIGIVMSLFNVVGGLIYGIAVLVDKEHRKEGAILIAFALVWFFVAAFLIGPWLIKSGILPNYKLMKAIK